MWAKLEQALLAAAEDCEYADLDDDKLRLGMIALRVYHAMRKARSAEDMSAMAVYGRRISEWYCMLVYGHFVKVEGDRHLGWSLYDSIQKLPNWAGLYAAKEYIVASRSQRFAADLDLPPSVRMRNDLTYCDMKSTVRMNGKFVTASIQQLRNEENTLQGDLEENTLQQAVCRIAVVLTSWLLRLQYGSADRLTSRL